MKEILSLIFLIVFIPPALADYKPPVDRRRQRTQSQIVRGCEGNKAKISIAAPNNGIGSTGSSNPTFIVDFSQLPPTPVIISITQPEAIEPIYYREFVPEKAGMMEITTNANLKAGEYVLKIGYFCQRDPDREAIYVRVNVRKIDLSSEQQLDIKNSDDPQQLLASWGLYFDLAALEYKQSPSNLSKF